MGALGSLPAPLGPAVGSLLGRFLGAIAASRTRRASENLKAAFPDASADQINGWVRGMWDNLGRSVWEFSRMPALTPEAYFRRVKVEGLELLLASHAKGKGVVMFASHLGNWEWASLFMAFSGLPVGAVARRMKNPFFDDFITRLRSHHGVTVLPHKNAVREGLRWLKAGKCLGVLIDQRITAGGTRVPFFGRLAHTTTMPALLAHRTGSAVHGISSRREGESLIMTVHPAFDLDRFQGDAVAATAAMTADVESWVRRAPSNWLWIHNRWKE
jgi:Kdo2-lipid IVA lauroyltransferase/acyltransferase